MPIEMVRIILEEAFRRYGAKPTYDEFRATAFDMFPDEMEAMHKSFARSGWLKWFKDSMRKTFNTDEMDPNAPQVQIDLLPGIGAPAYINVGSYSNPQPKRFTDCTTSDLEVAINTRKVVMARTEARIEDLQMKLAWLVSHAENEEETIAEVCSRLTVPA